MVIFSCQVALVDEDEDEDKDEAFDDGDVLGREVGRRWEGGRVSDVSEHNAGGGAPRRWPKTSRPDFPMSAIGAGGTTTTTTTTTMMTMIQLPDLMTILLPPPSPPP